MLNVLHLYMLSMSYVRCVKLLYTHPFDTKVLRTFNIYHHGSVFHHTWFSKLFNMREDVRKSWLFDHVFTVFEEIQLSQVEWNHCLAQLQLVPTCAALPLFITITHQPIPNMNVDSLDRIMVRWYHAVINWEALLGRSCWNHTGWLCPVHIQGGLINDNFSGISFVQIYSQICKDCKWM